MRSEGKEVGLRVIDRMILRSFASPLTPDASRGRAR